MLCKWYTCILKGRRVFESNCETQFVWRKRVWHPLVIDLRRLSWTWIVVVIPVQNDILKHACLSYSQTKTWVGKYFEFRRATVFGLGHRFSKHKTSRCSVNFGRPCLLWPPPLATPLYCLRAVSLNVLFELFHLYMHFLIYFICRELFH